MAGAEIGELRLDKAEGAEAFTHSGERYVLGYGQDFYGVWERPSLGQPVRRFPRTDDGWREAWREFSSFEPWLGSRQWQFTVPESVKLAPASGTNLKTKLVERSVRLITPKIIDRFKLFGAGVVPNPDRLLPPVPTTISTSPFVLSTCPLGFWGANRS